MFPLRDGGICVMMVAGGDHMAWNLAEALPYLAAKDKRMAAAIEELGGMHREPTEGLFHGLVQSIIGQQISMRAADTVWQRLCTLLGEVTPTTVAAAEEAALQSCGMSLRKASYLHGAAEAFLDGRIDESALSAAPDEEVIGALTQLKGVGRWTAEMLLIFSLGRQDVMSFGDYGLRKGLCLLYHHQDMPQERFMRYARRFHPYGTAASLILWEIAGGKAPNACDWKR